MDKHDERARTLVRQVDHFIGAGTAKMHTAHIAQALRDTEEALIARLRGTVKQLFEDAAANVMQLQRAEAVIEAARGLIDAPHSMTARDPVRKALASYDAGPDEPDRR